MEHISRMARSAASVLVNIAEGRGLLGIETSRKTGMRLALQEATGCAPGTGDGAERHRIYRDGKQVTHDADHGLRTAIGADMTAWLRCDADPPVLPSTVSLPEGAVEIVERSGVSLKRALLMVEMLYHVAFDAPTGAQVVLRRMSRGCSLDYVRKGSVHWTNGLVTIRHKALPAAISTALTGSPLSRLVDDTVLADRLIRKVCGVDPREGRLRIVTMDEGRRRTIMEGNGNG